MIPNAQVACCFIPQREEYRTKLPIMLNYKLDKHRISITENVYAAIVYGYMFQLRARISIAVAFFNTLRYNIDGCSSGRVRLINFSLFAGVQYGNQYKSMHSLTKA